MIVGAITAAPAAESAVFKNRRRGIEVPTFDMTALLVLMIAGPNNGAAEWSLVLETRAA
jgi:hypothetical protein